MYLELNCNHSPQVQFFEISYWRKMRLYFQWLAKKATIGASQHLHDCLGNIKRISSNWGRIITPPNRPTEVDSSFISWKQSRNCKFGVWKCFIEILLVEGWKDCIREVRLNEIDASRWTDLSPPQLPYIPTTHESIIYWMNYKIRIKDTTKNSSLMAL